MWLAADIAFWALALLLHAVVSRLPGRGNSVLRFMVAGTLAGCGLIGALHLFYGPSAQLFAGIAVYAFFCELYIFLFTLAISSISANLLINLSIHGMTKQEIDRKYDSSSMVAQRMERMVGTGLLEATPNGLQLTFRGQYLFRMFELLRRFFRHAPSVTENT